MYRAKSKIREADKKAVRLLCSSFNESLRSGKEYKVALTKMIESQKQFIPELKGLDSNSILASYNAQIVVSLPQELRNRAIKLITHLVQKHINPKLSASDCFFMEAFIDEQLLQLKEWLK
ncbi:hypothetical protein [Polynucleobacter sp. AP-Feld-500C-C5]|uniref:hypothetical protein n=1 Tax=Polynucleobacter sp. AP-Feld-500C-C5 TaxID=2576924 RepID=UPI001C0AE6BC|nr:hypothetical protein [Polynucleobacter sp. AP-Feld-500C-C5]MBU3633122.1 hypothetical protein [Polynucleobacter sp. AP-Feld-500C-C5]